MGGRCRGGCAAPSRVTEGGGCRHWPGWAATVALVREVVMLDLEYRHVDVFSRRALRGNGLVVVLNAASLPAAVMQEVTREVRQFETVFLTEVDLAGGSARLRIFTEDEEL